MSDELLVPTDVVRECLERSGYLMESRLVRMLTEADFFVEPNVSHKDPRTSKAREIDLTAETVPLEYSRGICVKTTFVIEAINNRFPVVLLTERPNTPNADFESYIKFGIGPSPCPFEIGDIYEKRGANHDNLFSQYCALSKKNAKDEFMASHPDDMYASLLKLSEYTEDRLAEFESWISEEESKTHWRVFTWHPMLVVSGQLMTAKVSAEGKVELQDTPLARLEFNWHDGDGRKTTVVEVIREDFLLERMNFIRYQDDMLRAHISKQRPPSEKFHLED